jgi:hypothetical protein
MFKTIYAAVLISSLGKIVNLPVAADSVEELQEIIDTVFPDGVYTDPFGNKETGTVTMHPVLYSVREEVNVNDIKRRNNKESRTVSARKRLRTG